MVAVVPVKGLVRPSQPLDGTLVVVLEGVALLGAVCLLAVLCHYLVRVVAHVRQCLRRSVLSEECSAEELGSHQA